MASRPPKLFQDEDEEDKEDQIIKYRRRKGTAGISGQLLEIELSMYVLLKAVERKENNHEGNLYLSANMFEAGDFDDLVAKYVYKDPLQGIQRTKILFVQAKHKDNPEVPESMVTKDRLLSPAEKKDMFMLKHYFYVYREIRKEFAKKIPDHPIFAGHIDECEFIIYSNALAHRDIRENETNFKRLPVDEEHFLNFGPESYYYQMCVSEEGNSDLDKQILDTLKYSCHCRKLAKELVKSIFPEKSHLQPEITNLGIIRKYDVQISEKVICKKTKKVGNFQESFLEGDETLSPQSQTFRKVFFDELQKKIPEKTQSQLISELRELSIKLPDNLGAPKPAKKKDDEEDEEPIVDLPDDVVTDADIHEFLTQLKLFIEQPNETRLAEIIKQRMQSIFGVMENEIDSVYSDVETKIRTWWKTDDFYLTERNKFFHQSAKVSISFDVKKPVDLFTGRIDELDELHKKMHRSSENVTVISQTTSISGLGGIGKTELARWYIQTYRKKYSDNIIWINAEKEETLITSFETLAKDKLKIPTTDSNGKRKEIESIVAHVYRHLSKVKCLFIFDNAEAGKYLRKFLPLKDFPANAKKPFILITSRIQEWDKGIEIVRLGEFKLEEAVEFVKKALGIPILDDSQDETIKQLVNLLQRFPLALQQAIAYIDYQMVTDDYSIEDYLDEYKEMAEELLDSEEFQNIDNDYAKTTFTTWQITIDKIKGDKQNGELASTILNLIAYCAPDNIPREMFLTTAKGNERQLKAAVRLIVLYSMVKSEQKQSVLSVHRLVQEVTRIKIKQGDEEEDYLRNLLDITRSNLDKTRVGHAISAWSYVDIYDGLVKEFSNLPELVLNELDKGVRFVEGDIFGRKTFELFHRVLDEKHEDLLSCESAFVPILYGQGKYVEADDMANRVIEIEKRPEMLLKTKQFLTTLYIKQGKYQDALETIQKVLEERQATYTPNHEIVLRTLNLKAEVLRFQSKYLESLEILQELLRIRQQTFPEDDLEVLRNKHNIADVLRSLGRYEESYELFLEVLQKRSNIIGKLHPDTITTQHEISNVLKDLRRYDEAVEALKGVVEGYTKILGANHPSTLIAEGNMGVTYRLQERDSEALAVFTRVYEKKKEAVGADHPDTLVTLNNMAYVLGRQGKYPEALRMFNEILTKRKAQLGEKHIQTVTTRYNLASLLRKLGNYDESLKTYREILDIYKELVQGDHINITFIKGNMANILTDQGKYDEASQIYEEVLSNELLIKTSLEDHLQISYNKAINLYHQHKYEEAYEIIESVLNKRIELLGPEHPSTLVARRTFAIILSHMHRSDEALTIIEETLEKQKEKLVDDHVDILKTLMVKADILLDMNRHEEALEIFSTVYDKLRSECGQSHPETLNAREGIARARERNGDVAEVLKIFEEVHEEMRKLFGDGHRKTVSALENVNRLKSLLDDSKKQP